ncbi:hypothetical protein Dsin_009336 [Dipteronia sinensis]|uniref:Reverse transcriptase domain-containing protein n=1 Tax=Dipteronia sinensis TaxID=43782 RepID=A0AAE0AQD1_9ROSI|nr:hypothetical protein Dsin_009336 [Dipteronia sinensis]
MSNIRRKSNFIRVISIFGRLCSGPAQVREGVFSFFKDHFKKVGWTRLRIVDLYLKKISEEQSLLLEVDFLTTEVLAALRDCDGDKAPRPDGLNLLFIRANWEVIKDDFMSFLHEFHNDGSVVKHLNHTHVALIPKIRNLVSLKDYRPISLIGSLYKILAKLLANRLKLVMDVVIGPTQMAFVKDHQIMDSFVIAEEFIHS